MLSAYTDQSVAYNAVTFVIMKATLASNQCRLSVPDFVLQLWRKIGSNFSSKLRDKIRNGKPGFEAKQLCLGWFWVWNCDINFCSVFLFAFLCNLVLLWYNTFWQYLR